MSHEMLIIDLEATCWRGHPPQGQQSEIIEIGVCVLDLETSDIRQARSILVAPQRSQVSEFCIELTTITPAMLTDAPTFEEACAILESDYNSRQHRWGSWGNYDRRMFADQCASFGIAYPLGERHINLKKRFSALRGLKNGLGMAGALGILELELTGTHHRGGDDAFNIARIARAMLKAYGEAALD